MTPDTAPEAIIQAREVFAVECEKHGFTEQAKNIRAGNVSYEDGGQVCLDAMIAYARRLTSHSAGEGLREALEKLERRPVHDGYDNDTGEYIWIDYVRWDDVRELLALTPPSDAGSTTRSGGEGGALSLDDYAYDELWGAIAAATRIEAGIVAISVVKFREAIRAIATTRADKRNEAFTITLPSDMGSAEVQDQGDGKFAVWVRSAEGDYKSAWNLPSFEVAVRNIMGVLWNGCLPFATTPSPDASLDSGQRCSVPGCDNLTNLGICDQCDGWVDEQVAALNAVPSPDGEEAEKWRENVAFLLNNCPATIRACEGGGSEDLIQSLVLTFARLQSALPTTPSPDASPDSGERKPHCTLCWIGVPNHECRSPSPAIVKEAGEVERLRKANAAIVSALLDRYPGKAKRIQDIHIEERGEYCIELWLGEGSGYITISTYPLALAALSASNAAQVSK